MTIRYTLLEEGDTGVMFSMPRVTKPDRQGVSKTTRFVAAFVLCMFATIVTATAAKRVALVLGNGAYTNAPGLANPANDAAIVGQALRKAGFDVVTVLDGSQSQMRKGLSEFGRRAQGADIALFYFAGHGIQVAGKNWLLPVDADIESSTDLPANALSANDILELMELSGAKARIAILDACRNNPLTRSLSRATSRGLAKIDSSAAGSMIVFATAPGDVALDGSGSNSPFSKSLASQLLVPGVEIRQMIGRVRRDVMSETSDQQVPWVNEALVGDIFLVPGQEKQQQTDKSVSNNSVSQDNNNTAVELAFWDSVKNSEDKNLLELYVQRYPNGIFTEIAELKLAKLIENSSNQANKPQFSDNNQIQQSGNNVSNQRIARLNPEPAIDRTSQMREAARHLLLKLHNAGSASDREFLNGLSGFYAENVNFYGKHMSLRDIRKDKTRYVKRWPSRYYHLRQDALNINCYPNSRICTSEGTLDWEVSSSKRNARISGSSTAYYEIEFFNSGPKIVVEDGQVLKRN